MTQEGQLLGNITTQNKLSLSSWRAAYESVHTSRIIANNPLQALRQINTQLQSYTQGNVIALPIFYLQYATFRQDAASANLISAQNKVLFDVPNRLFNPYLLKTSFGVAPTQQENTTGEMDFVFKSNHFYTNTGLSIQTLEADFDNGQGYQIMQWNINKHVVYSSSGQKTLRYRIKFSNNLIQEGHSNFEVFLPLVSNIAMRYSENQTPPTIRINPNGERAGGTGHILYSDENMALPISQRRIRKPLIIVEGFDASFIAPQLQSENYDWRRFIRDISETQIINNQQTFNDLLSGQEGKYDVIFVDYDNGADDIRRNAEMFREIIKAVNLMKEPLIAGQPKEKNVVIGISMGGLVSRYGLATMVRDHNENPDTRLLITHDSPHRGANVPLGIQIALKTLYSYRNTNGISSLADQVGLELIDQATTALMSPAAQQMLINLHQDNSVPTANLTHPWPQANAAHRGFLAGEYRSKVTGFVEPYEFVATSMGSECAIPNIAPGGLLASIDGGGPIMLFGGLNIGDLMIDVKLNALSHFGNTRVFYVNISRRVGWGWFSSTSTIVNVSSSVSGSPAWDSSPGGSLSINVSRNSQSTINIPSYIIKDWWFFDRISIFNSTSTNAQADFCFVPLISALDINTLNIFQVTNTNYSEAPTSVRRFITQEPEIINGVLKHNKRHPSAVPTRTARWIFKQMETNYNVTNSSLICDRPCPPSGLPNINISNALMCVGEQRVLTTNTNWTNIVITTSANLVYNAAPNRSVTAIDKGYAWIIIKATVNDCQVHLKSIYLWIGEPYGTNAIRLVNFTNPRYAPNGTLQVCSGSVLTFETDFDLLPNGADAGVTAFEWDGGTILSQDDNLTNEDLSGENTGHHTTPHIAAAEGEVGLKPRTSRVTIKFPIRFATSFVNLRVRLKNRCGVSEWIEYAILVDVDYCYSGGTPIGPGAGPWDIISPVAFENPIGSGRLKMRLMNIPDVDYNNLDPKTLAGFTYQIKLYNNQGDEKLIWEGNTVESDADVSFLQQGLYSAKVVFGNGQCVKNIHLIKE